MTTDPHANDLRTDRLVLHPLSVADSERLVAGGPYHRTPDYPREGDISAARRFLRVCAEKGDPSPYANFEIRLRESGLPVGGIGFHDAEDESGAVTVGYGLIPQAWGKGYATEALREVVRFARACGATRVKGDADHANVASQRVMRAAGMLPVGEDAEVRYFEVAWDGAEARGLPVASAPYSRFAAPDGTRLAYRVVGSGTDGTAAPVVCLPGGPLHDSRYLGDLGGLAEASGRRLLFLDFRGSGGSDVPADPGSYRCDRLVEDVEALRVHLGLPALDLLGHSAGANVAVRYAARHPGRLARLVLITPSTRAVGIEIPDAMRRAGADLRQGEDWYPQASAALSAIAAGGATAENFAAVTPFFWGRWDEAARAHTAEWQAQNTNPDPGRSFGAQGAFDPAATRAALARLTVPVGLLAGEYDLNSPPRSTEEFAGLFPNADTTCRVQAGAGHYPWLDDPKAFTRAVADLLR